MMWSALFTKHNARSQCVHAALKIFCCSFTLLVCASMWLHKFLNVWYNLKFTPKLFGYVLSGFLLWETQSGENTTATHDEIYDFLFNLPCLLQRLVDNHFVFSLSPRRALRNRCDALGRWIFLLLHTANSFGELRLGGFHSLASRTLSDRRRTESIWSRFRPTIERLEHFLQLRASFFELENSIFASGNYFITNIFHHFTQLSWKRGAL